MFSIDKEQAKINNLDIRIALVVIITFLTYRFIPTVEHVPTSVAAIVCMQKDLTASWKSGMTRIMVTIVGGVVGVGVVLVDDLVQSKILFLLAAFFGVLLTLLCCKVVHIPERVGCVTFVLVVSILSGEARVQYAILRFLNTFYGVLIAVVITAIWSFVHTRRKKIEKSESLQG